jgi:catechol 2,3-dioxygenase-like lactoylglutathione lyase family enzyme
MSISGIDHVALPMQHTDAMVAFYRALGFDVVEHRGVVQVFAGANLINFHASELWQRVEFTLRAPAAVPPCGDLCFVWDGSDEQLRARLDAAGASIEEGPVAREGGRRAPATSVYTRDPDGNLLEFLRYGPGASRRPGS